MGIDLAGYFNIKEKAAFLRRFYEEHGQDALFIVPSGLDTETLLGLICGERAYFGDRPQVMTVGGLNGLLAEKTGVRRRVVDPPDHNLILRYLMERYTREALDSGRKLPKGTAYKGFISLLGQNIKDLLNEEVSPEQLRAALFGSEAPQDGAPETLLLDLYKMYIDYLDEFGLADAAQIPTLAREAADMAAGLEFVKSKKIVFTGFLTFTGAQLRLVRALAQSSDIVMLQPETGLDKLHDGRMQLLNFPAELKHDISSAPSEWRLPTALFAGSSPHLEFEALARETALWADGAGCFTALGKLTDYGDIGMTVEPHRVDIMKYALGRYHIPFSEQVRGTVGETLFGGLPSVIWDAWQAGFDNYTVKILLASPLLLSQPVGGGSAQDGSFPDSFSEWQAVLPKEAAALLQRVKDFCRALEEGGGPLKILQLWRAFAEETDCAGLCADAAADIPALDQTVKDVSYALYELKKKIRRLEEQQSDIGPAAEVHLAGAEAAAFICDWGATATLPIQPPQSRALTLYSGTPPILASHRFMIMTDIDYNTWPGTLRESLLFRNSNKAKFNDAEKERAKRTSGAEVETAFSHLPELSEEREQKEALFRRLTAAGEEGLIIARSLTDASQDPVEESLFTVNMVTYKDAARNAGLEKETRRCWPEAAFAEYTAESAMPDGSAPWFPDVEIVSSPSCEGAPDVIPEGISPPHGAASAKPTVPISRLDTWKSCPYHYWCESELDIEEPADTLYSAMEAGSLFHRIWEECMDQISEGKERSFRAFVEENWERIKGECYPGLSEEPRLVRFEKKLRAQAARIAEIQDEIEAKAMAAGRTSVETEVSLEDHEVDGVIFRAKADRIDYYGSEAVVIDYKLGAAENHKHELQVPAYCNILSEKKGVDIKGFGWLGHGDGALKGVFDGRYYDIYAYPAASKKGAQDPSDRVKEAAEAMAAMAANISEGVYRPNYSAKDARCTNCPFYVLCRKREGAVWDAQEEEGEADGGN